tara:strand:+ start:163 stop:576 length:414 start_codon:yes stop_codon:yes gene_type:complete
LGKKKYKITKDLIDLNNHVGEDKYYNIGLKALWQMNEESGMDKIFLEENIAPVTFNSEIKFFKEIFKDEYIEVNIEIYSVPNDLKKWERIIKIYNHKNELSAQINSKGAFFNLETRKIQKPSKKIIDMFKETDYANY